MDFVALMVYASLKSCHARNICTLLSRPDFRRLYEAAMLEDRMRVEQLVEAGAHETLRAWYRSKLNRELGDKCIRDLRQIASELCIPDYTRLKKSNLLSEIVKRQHE